MPTAPTSAPELVDLIRRSGVLPPSLLASLSDLNLPNNPQQAAAFLVAQGILTRFQAKQLLVGRHKGFRLGPYVVKDLLGRGGMGAVYLAEHRELNRKVAVKILVPSKDEDQRLALERFFREARAAAALDHPNIVRIFDVARHNEVPYLVMEYVEGQTLQQVLDERGPIPYLSAADYIAQAAAGLQHAHEKGFVHRDIKPGNLMLDRAGTIKILDMGLARSAGAHDKLTERLDHGAVVGTADFIAPEQALNQTVIDGRADIYSLGATFFALLIGKPPFEGNTTQKLLQHQLRSAPKLTTLDKSLPKDLSVVVARMLAKKPSDRYQTPVEVIVALKPWLTSGSRALTGLSQTTLGCGLGVEDSQSNRLTDGTSRPQGQRSGVRRSNSDSEAVGPLDPGLDTGSLAISGTLRVRRQLRPVSQKQLLYVGTIVIVLAIGAVSAWLVAGQDRNQELPPPVDSTPQPNTQTLPTLPGPPSGMGSDSQPKPAEELQEQVLFNLAAGELPNFRFTRTGFEHTSGDSPPQLPGVLLGGYKKETESEWICTNIQGSQALSFANLNDVRSAQVAIDLEKPDGLGLTLEPGQQVRLRVTYLTLGQGRGQMYFQSYDDWKLLASRTLPNVHDWNTVDLVVTRGNRPIQCVIETRETGASNAIAIRTITVTAVQHPTRANSSARRVTADISKWVEGSVIYSLDVQAIPPFRVIKEQFNRINGEEEQLPWGVGCQAWKDGAIGEFRCEKLYDVPVLSVTNLNEVKSGQFFFELEQELKLSLQPGKAYRVKIGYSTANEATGVVYLQTCQDFKIFASRNLPQTNGQWKTASVSFVRPPAHERVPVRMVIENTSVGEGKTLSIRSVQLVELIPPLE
jgi:serine/threonine protein kinase